MISGYLGIDVGTQGLSVVFVDHEGTRRGLGEAKYEMVANLADGFYEQRPADWETALATATRDLWASLRHQQIEFEVLGIGIAGQMHGEVLIDAEGQVIETARLWCDSRNEAEGEELTELFAFKVPKRMTIARWLWTVRHRPDLARSIRHLTTPAGWIAHRLTGEWILGIGEASGMFPIDPATFDYSVRCLDHFAGLTRDLDIQPLQKLLSTVRKAGEPGEVLNESGSRLLGLPAGTPLAPAEGDQPASLAGSLIAAAGTVSVVFGTSVVANTIGDRAFRGVDLAVDHFCAPDGQPFNMVCLRNGTTYMNSLVESYGKQRDLDQEEAFRMLMPEVVAAAPDCGGLLALPFLDDEPAFGIPQGGHAALAGQTDQNDLAGNAIKAGLLATIFNLKIGVEILDDQGFPRNEIVLSGGLTRTPELAQIVADVMKAPVTLLPDASEGCAWGAALLARFSVECSRGAQQSGQWEVFLENLVSNHRARYEPDEGRSQSYQQVFGKYKQLLRDTFKPD